MWCIFLRKLPEEMKNLINLRHLYNEDGRHVPVEIGCLTSLQTLLVFEVGTKRGRRIGELGFLVELGGELGIDGLEKVREKEEARGARLGEKKKLHKLRYRWTSPFRKEGYCKDEEVLEGLEPHSNLKSLHIEGYGGVYYPSWLVRRKNGGEPSTCFQPMNLVELKLFECKNVNNLPSLGQYPNLKFLEIQGLNSVRCIGNEFYMNGCDQKPIILFPALEKFTLKRMKEVKEWLEVEPTIPVFPSLKELLILSCDNLNIVPRMSRFSSLEILTIEDCREFSWRDGELFPSSLKKLEIESCKNLTSIPSVEGGFSFLQGLELMCEKLCKIGKGLLASTCLTHVCIRTCHNLRFIPFDGGSQSLLKLTLTKCKELREIEGGLYASTRLEMLEIVNCLSMISIPSLDGFSSLLELKLNGCKGLTSIPSGFSTCTSLQRLFIEECSNLESIPFDGGSQSLLKLSLIKCEELKEIEGGLSASTRLETLEIKNCPSMISIPSLEGLSSLLKLKLKKCRALTSLPNGFSTCTSLQRLFIRECSNLESIPDDLGQLHSLESLCIRDCRSLKRFPQESLGCLTRLKTLRLGPFSKELEEFPGLASIHHLHSSLKQLILMGWGDKLSTLPHQLQHLTALEELGIWNFCGVNALPDWLGNLSSLRELCISSFKNLEHLPSKEALQRLSNLHSFRILSCPRLRENKVEMSKISNIAGATII